MKNIKLSKSEARKFLIKYQGLEKIRDKKPKDEILKFFNKAGCIQYDPLNVVGRNPDLVLQSRIKGYRPEILQEMLYTDRSLIDGWDKMMAIYRVEDWYNFFRVRQQNNKDIKRVLEQRNSSKALDITEDIRKIIMSRGPVKANEIAIGSGGKGRWGHKKLSSAALDYMFHNGELGIYDKINTHKRYELIQNLLPPAILDHPDPFDNDREFIKWYIKRRIGSVGMLWARSGGGWLGHFLSNKKLRVSLLNELVEEKTLMKISVEQINEPFYIRQEDLILLESISNRFKKHIRFLAPLDNLLWDRDMIEKIFDFSYRWEVYVPADKRKYGYYVLPVLYGDRFIARFEAEKHRGNQPLDIKSWWWEENITVTSEMKSAIKQNLSNFCDYLQADGIKGDILKEL